MSAIKQLLVPVDFSAQSGPVLRYALSVAGAWNAGVHILYVNELTSLPFGSSSYPFGVVTFPELEKELNDWATGEYAKLLQDLPRADQARCSFSLVSGKAADQISRLASTEHADLIVLAAHTHGVVEKFFLGSTMERLVRISEVPLMVMRDPEVVPHYPPSGILVTTDYSAESFQVFPFVKEILTRNPVPVTILAVDSLETGFLGVASEETRNFWMTELSGTGARVSWKTVRATDPVEGILSVIQEEKPELVAMTTHGRSGLSKVLLGSTTEAIIRQIHLPVLVHHIKRNS